MNHHPSIALPPTADPHSHLRSSRPHRLEPPLSPPNLHILAHLRQILRRIALIRLDNLPINQLLIRIRRINNRLPLDHRKRLKAVSGPKLSAPVAADCESAALLVVVAGAGGRCAGHSVGAGGGGSGLGVDAVGVLAGCVGGVAGADEGLEGPLGRRGGHHGDFGGGGGGHGGEGGGHGGDEEGAELHVGMIEGLVVRLDVRIECGCEVCGWL